MGYILMNVGVNNRASTINQIFVGVNNIARLVYQGGGGSGSFQLPTFTGSSSIFGDETSGRIELYESGTLTLFPGMYDIFLVGGGSSGSSNLKMGAGGGGGGYTTTSLNKSVSDRSEFNVVVGAGGNGTSGGTTGSNGGNTSISGTPFSLSVNGATATQSQSLLNGIAGGSGGGAGAGGNSSASTGYGGSNGGAGGNSSSGSKGGQGQGTTTRMFGESDNTLYSGGGGGGSYGGAGGSGGQGGGGTGASQAAPAKSGTVNTGGGGGGAGNGGTTSGSGGSGIVIVRWGGLNGVELSTLSEGTTVLINEDGNPAQFYVVKHNYETSLNGAGRTLLVRKDCHSNQTWNINHINAYANGTLDNWFNTTYKEMFDTSVQQLMGSTNFYYTPGQRNNTVATLARSIFTPSLEEYGLRGSGLDNMTNAEGTTFTTPIAIANLDGSPVSHWTRSPYFSQVGNLDYYAAGVTDVGGASVSFEVNDQYGARPCFTLPDTTIFTDNGDGTYTLVG